MRQGLTDQASEPVGGISGSVSVTGTVLTLEFERTMSVAEGVVAASGTMIAAPGAGLQIVLSSLMIQNESAVVTTVEVLDAVVIGHGVLDQRDSLSESWPVAREWVCPDNTPLLLSLSGANQHSYIVFYYTR